MCLFNSFFDDFFPSAEFAALEPIANPFLMWLGLKIFAPILYTLLSVPAPCCFHLCPRLGPIFLAFFIVTFAGKFLLTLSYLVLKCLSIW